MDFLKVPNSKNEWILNTPERKGILDDGAPKHASLNLLGKGAFGSVFKAIFQDRPVALKIVKNRNNINITENEANILGWKHRNIVRILMIESTIKYGLIIMEHFPSLSLQQVLDAVNLSLKPRVFIVLDILNALGYCHKRNLLHLDVKPQNVLVSFRATQMPTKQLKKIERKYYCKLCDFGSSIKLDEQKRKKFNAGGTIRYMSPEALRAGHLSNAADIYSLGILMWQLQQRRLPYEGIQCNEIVAFQVVKNNLRPNSDLSQFLMPDFDAVSISAQLQKVICQCSSVETRRTIRNMPNFSGLNMTPFKRKCHSDRKNKSLTLSISPHNLKTGSSIQILHSSTAIKNVARNLSKDLDVKTEIISSHEKPLNFNLLFENTFNWSDDLLKAKETFYSSIYESCWHAEPEMRPKVKAVKMKLKQIWKSET